MYGASVNNFDEWRKAARDYLQADIAPEFVQWSCQQTVLFTDQELGKDSDHTKKAVNVSAQFISKLKLASCYLGKMQPEKKWSLFYSLLWRITKIDRNALLIKSNSDVQQLERMVKSVNRDMHKMKAFVRFKTDTSILEQPDIDLLKTEDGDAHYIAWFEPEHAIIEAIAPFFVKRFTVMNWSILTPYGCVHWNQQQLIHSPGISRPDLQEDEFDMFWCTYYRSIFNPARLKQQAMRSEMPKKYWKYLPESICINDLVTRASARVTGMVDADATDSERVRKASKRVTELQNKLRRENRS